MNKNQRINTNQTAGSITATALAYQETTLISQGDRTTRPTCKGTRQLAGPLLGQLAPRSRDTILGAEGEVNHWAIARTERETGLSSAGVK